jgi:phosphohistidine phosphatase SixA
MRILIFILIFCYWHVDAAQAAESTENYTIYLLRHAEKQADGSKDPALTDTGKTRSKKMAKWLQDKNVTDVWSSDYIRTRDTAGPLITELGLQLHIYDPSDLEDLAMQLTKRRHNAVVVGHSNTTPELARLLCDCEVSDMEETEYDRLIVVSVANGKTAIETLKQN